MQRSHWRGVNGVHSFKARLLTKATFQAKPTQLQSLYSILGGKAHQPLPKPKAAKMPVTQGFTTTVVSDTLAQKADPKTVLAEKAAGFASVMGSLPMEAQLRLSRNLLPYIASACAGTINALKRVKLGDLEALEKVLKDFSDHMQELKDITALFPDTTARRLITDLYSSGGQIPYLITLRGGFLARASDEKTWNGHLTKITEAISPRKMQVAGKTVWYVSPFHRELYDRLNALIDCYENKNWYGQKLFLYDPVHVPEGCTPITLDEELLRILELKCEASRSTKNGRNSSLMLDFSYHDLSDSPDIEPFYPPTNEELEAIRAYEYSQLSIAGKAGLVVGAVFEKVLSVAERIKALSGLLGFFSKD